jgi:tetratricopeptide (TPR) repeat protein
MPRADPGPRRAASKRASSGLLLGLLLGVLTLFAYFPATAAGFVWDDDLYLTQNPCLRDWRGLARLWIPGNTVQYYPAVFTTFWVEQRVFGLEPAGYHIVNVVLHALNAVLVWRVCRGLWIPGAWFVGAVFAVHPVHVESVAWITERKNVLSGLFYLAAFLAYRRFQAEDAVPRKNGGRTAPPQGRAWRWYGAALILFVLALLSKTVTCSLPAALILAMLWRREPVTVRRLLPLAPLFALGLALALLTLWLEQTQVGAQGPESELGLAQRVIVASRALLFYAQKLLVPAPLIFVYPRWEIDPSRLASYGPLAVVLVLSAAAITAWRREARGPALALAFFAGTLFPALGFLDVYYQMRYSYVADHFQYLASLGLIALVVGGVALRWTGSAASVAGALVLAVLGLLTWRQCTTYADAETLWRATIRQNPGAWMAHSNLAKLLSERGENQEALEHLQQALALPASARTTEQLRYNLAVTLTKLGHFPEALEQYRLLHASSNDMEVKLAQTLERLGRDEEAEEFYRQALEGERAPEALIPYGMHLVRRGRPEEAIVWFELYVRKHPDDANALMFLADAYAAAGRLDDAIQAAERALPSAKAQGGERMHELIQKRLGRYRGEGG